MASYGAFAQTYSTQVNAREAHTTTVPQQTILSIVDMLQGEAPEPTGNVVVDKENLKRWQRTRLEMTSKLQRGGIVLSASEFNALPEASKAQLRKHTNLVRIEEQ